MSIFNKLLKFSKPNFQKGIVAKKTTKNETINHISNSNFHNDNAIVL